MISPRKRVELALQKKFEDKVPFTIYESLIPRSTTERLLRNRGMCIVAVRNISSSIPSITQDCFGYKTYMPNVKTKVSYFEENEKLLVRTDYSTPIGDLYTINEPTQFSNWYHKMLFKSKKDYKILLFMIEDEQIIPDYEEVLETEKLLGSDFILRGNIGSEPFQSLLGIPYMSIENFCYEWEDNRDEILKLYKALVENRRKRYLVLANSPLSIINYGGNVTPEIVGLERFEKFYLPNYEEAAETLHKKNKLVGVHFDANCGMLKKAIGKTSIDYIEAFTPFPDTDMTVKDAREAWPDKVLWINFPSSVHLRSLQEIEQTTYQIIDDAGTPEGLIMGITEDVPEDRWSKNYLTILNAIDIKFNFKF